MTRARALRASNSIENINVSQEDAVAAVDGEDPAETDRQTWRAVVGYQQAMTYILQRCRDHDFQFSVDAILAIHFMISQSDLDANPGNFRRGWVGVRNTRTNEVVHEGVSRDRLEELMEELVGFLNAPPQTHLIIKAALAHLNLTLLHPFSDGNGRTSRCLQTAVLANEGIAAQTYSSIEEYIGHNQQEYYDVLADAGEDQSRAQLQGLDPILFDRALSPASNAAAAKHWNMVWSTSISKNLSLKRVCLRAPHLVYLRLPFGARVRNASYRVSTDISGNLASRDLKQLVDAGLLEAKGEKERPTLCRGRSGSGNPRKESSSEGSG